jgi:ankyrin repeat protein
MRLPSQGRPCCRVVQDGGLTALDAAACNGEIECLKELLRGGAAVNQANNVRGASASLLPCAKKAPRKKADIFLFASWLSALPLLT